MFCYQTDEGFSEKSDHMGTMSLEMYKQIVDQAAGNIEFLSLASRGEPLVCKDFEDDGVQRLEVPESESKYQCITFQRNYATLC